MAGNNEPLNRAGQQMRSGSARNYLIFLDDDDWFMPHHIAKLQAALINPFCHCRLFTIGVNESGEISRYEEIFDPIQLRIENFIPFMPFFSGVALLIMALALMKRWLSVKTGIFGCNYWSREHSSLFQRSEPSIAFSKVKDQGCGKIKCSRGR